jgi:hypothetical protein
LNSKSRQQQIIENCGMLHLFKPSTALSSSFTWNKIKQIKAPSDRILNKRWHMGAEISAEMKAVSTAIIARRKTELVATHANAAQAHKSSHWKPINLVLPNGSAGDSGGTVIPQMGMPNELSSGQVISPFVLPDSTPIFPTSTPVSEKRAPEVKWKKPDSNARRHIQIEEVRTKKPAGSEPEFDEGRSSLPGELSPAQTRPEQPLQDRTSQALKANNQPGPLSGKTQTPVKDQQKPAPAETQSHRPSEPEGKFIAAPASLEKEIPHGSKPSPAHRPTHIEIPSPVKPVEAAQTPAIQRKPAEKGEAPAPQIAASHPNTAGETSLPLVKPAAPPASLPERKTTADAQQIRRTEPPAAPIHPVEMKPADQTAGNEKPVIQPIPPARPPAVIHPQTTQPVPSVKPADQADKAEKPEIAPIPAAQPPVIVHPQSNEPQPARPVQPVVPEKQPREGMKSPIPMAKRVKPEPAGESLQQPAGPNYPVEAARLPQLAPVQPLALPVRRMPAPALKKEESVPPETSAPDRTPEKEETPPAAIPVNRRLMTRKMTRSGSKQPLVSLKREQPRMSSYRREPAGRALIQRKPVDAAHPLQVVRHVRGIRAEIPPQTEAQKTEEQPAVKIQAGQKPGEFHGGSAPVQKPVLQSSAVRKSTPAIHPAETRPARTAIRRAQILRKPLARLHSASASRSFVVQRKQALRSPLQPATARQAQRISASRLTMTTLSLQRVEKQPSIQSGTERTARQGSSAAAVLPIRLSRAGITRTISKGQPMMVNHLKLVPAVRMEPAAYTHYLSKNASSGVEKISAAPTGEPQIQMKPKSKSVAFSRAGLVVVHGLKRNSTEAKSSARANPEEAAPSDARAEEPHPRPEMPVVRAAQPEGSDNIVQRRAAQVSPQPAEQTGAQEDVVSAAIKADAAKKQKMKNLQDIAKKVYPMIRRMLEIEREQKTGRPF